MTAGAPPSIDAPERRVTLRRDGVYALEAFWSRRTPAPDLDAWFERRRPIERAYGAHPIMIVAPVKALYGEYLPTVVRLLTWPDSKAFDAFRRDPRCGALDPLLDEATAEATITLVRMHPEIHAYPDEVEVVLDDRLCYELCVFWDRPDAPRSQWDAFIAAATPSIEAHGGHPLFVFQPLRRERGDFFPTRFCVAAWDTVEHFESFVAAPEQGEISRLRWLAVERMDATATRLLADQA